MFKYVLFNLELFNITSNITVYENYGIIINPNDIVTAIILKSSQEISYLLFSSAIMITCPCNVDLLTPRFYIVKLKFTAQVYFIFLSLL